MADVLPRDMEVVGSLDGDMWEEEVVDYTPSAPSCFCCGKPADGPARRVAGYGMVYTCSGNCCIVLERRWAKEHPEPATSWPCATVPGDLAEWEERIGDHQIGCLRADGSRQALIILRTGGAELTVFDESRDGCRLVQLSVLTRPGTPEEAARIALRAAFLLGLVRTSGGQPR